MAKDPSLRAFKCPTCGAPLEPEVGTLTMKCSYCGSTVIIPESLRTAPPSSGPTLGEVFQFGLNGVDLNQIVGNAMHLPQAISLAQQGKVDEAASIYSQITGMKHDDAVAAVQRMAAGHAVSLTPGRPGATWQTFETSFSQPKMEVASPPASGSAEPTASRSGGRSCGLLFAIIAAVVLLIGGLLAGAFILWGGGGSAVSVSSLMPIGFASQIMSFGSEGIGAGMFQDPRSIGVDGSGRISVADYQDGRVQTFDPSGKYLSGFSVSTGGKKVYLQAMAIDRNGNVYLAHDQKIFVSDMTGKKTAEVGDDTHDYESAVIGGDGRLYAIANSETIVRFNPDYTIDLEIPDTFTTVTGDSDIDTHLAVDGLGNMYILGAFHYLVLKYSPQGTFVNQFGGEAKDAAVSEPAKFTAPTAIAVDGYGRVFVSDFFDIKVFDADGTYLDKIGMDKGAVFGMAFDDQNNLHLVTNQNLVMKYKVRPPVSK